MNIAAFPVADGSFPTADGAFVPTALTTPAAPESDSSGEALPNGLFQALVGAALGVAPAEAEVPSPPVAELNAGALVPEASLGPAIEVGQLAKADDVLAGPGVAEAPGLAVVPTAPYSSWRATSPLPPAVGQDKASTIGHSHRSENGQPGRVRKDNTDRLTRTPGLVAPSWPEPPSPRTAAASESPIDPDLEAATEAEDLPAAQTTVALYLPGSSAAGVEALIAPLPLLAAATVESTGPQPANHTESDASTSAPGDAPSAFSDSPPPPAASGSGPADHPHIEPRRPGSRVPMSQTPAADPAKSEEERRAKHEQEIVTDMAGSTRRPMETTSSGPATSEGRRLSPRPILVPTEVETGGAPVQFRHQPSTPTGKVVQTDAASAVPVPVPDLSLETGGSAQSAPRVEREPPSRPPGRSDRTPVRSDSRSREVLMQLVSTDPRVELLRARIGEEAPALTPALTPAVIDEAVQEPAGAEVTPVETDTRPPKQSDPPTGDELTAPAPEAPARAEFASSATTEVRGHQVPASIEREDVGPVFVPIEGQSSESSSGKEDTVRSEPRHPKGTAEVPAERAGSHPLIRPVEDPAGSARGRQLNPLPLGNARSLQAQFPPVLASIAPPAIDHVTVNGTVPTTLPKLSRDLPAPTVSRERATTELREREIAGADVSTDHSRPPSDTGSAPTRVTPTQAGRFVPPLASIPGPITAGASTGDVVPISRGATQASPTLAVSPEAPTPNPISAPAGTDLEMKTSANGTAQSQPSTRHEGVTLSPSIETAPAPAQPTIESGSAPVSRTPEPQDPARVDHLVRADLTQADDRTARLSIGEAEALVAPRPGQAKRMSALVTEPSKEPERPASVQAAVGRSVTVPAESESHFVKDSLVDRQPVRPLKESQEVLPQAKHRDGPSSSERSLASGTASNLERRVPVGPALGIARSSALILTAAPASGVELAEVDKSSSESPIFLVTPRAGIGLARADRPATEAAEEMAGQPPAALGALAAREGGVAGGANDHAILGQVQKEPEPPSVASTSTGDSLKPDPQQTVASEQLAASDVVPASTASRDGETQAAPDALATDEPLRRQASNHGSDSSEKGTTDRQSDSPPREEVRRASSRVTGDAVTGPKATDSPGLAANAGSRSTVGLNKDAARTVPAKGQDEARQDRAEPSRGSRPDPATYPVRITEWRTVRPSGELMERPGPQERVWGEGVENEERGRGTSAAQSQHQMKYAANRYEFAPSHEQDLPGGSTMVAEPPGQKTVARSLEVGEKLARKESDAAGVVGRVDSPQIKLAGLESTSEEPIKFNSPNHERLFQQIETEVKLVSAKAERLSVVLKPDNQTEILLQLRWHDGQVEAHARCERGNFDALNAEWGQLQQALSSSGVRLAPLAASLGTGYEWLHHSPGQFDANSAFHHQKNPSETPPRFEPTEVPAPRANRTPAGRIRPRARAPHRLLESWA